MNFSPQRRRVRRGHAENLRSRLKVRFVEATSSGANAFFSGMVGPSIFPVTCIRRTYTRQHPRLRLWLNCAAEFPAR